MLIPFVKLKDTALLVSNILRDFDPETMFWRIDSPILFPNYDKDGFTPFKDVRKPFSVQIILESFSRSCGYKSYNALLADQHRLEILDVHLNDLNPAPRNAYYTEYWNNFINTMLQSIHTGVVNKTIPSYLTYRNFKFDEHARKRMAFMGLSLNAICDVSGAKKFDFDFIPHYYPIALSVLMTALQFPRHKLEGVVPETQFPIRPEFPVYLTEYIERGVDHSLIIPDLPLTYFLVHEKWHEPNFKLFKTNLMITMHEVFGVSLNIVEHSDDPLDSVVNVVMPYDFYEVYNHGTKMLALHEKLQSYVVDKANAVAHDKGYYTHADCKAITATRSDFIPREFNWNVQQGLKKSKDINDHVIYGNKAFWLNQCCHLFTPRPESMLHWNNASLEESVDFMLNHLFSYRELASVQRRSAHQFKIQGINQFIKNTRNFYKVQDIPKLVTVYTNTVLHPTHPTTENKTAQLAVHAKLMALLQSTLSPIDMKSKIMGDLDIFEFKDYMPGLINPTLKIKEVNPDIADYNKSVLHFDLNYPELVYSIALERITDDTIETLGLNPYRTDIGEYLTENIDGFDFKNYEGSFEDLIFTTKSNEPGYFCKFRIGLYDAPYKSKNRYDPRRKMNEFTMVCKLPSLDPDKLDYVQAFIAYNNEEYGAFKDDYGFWHSIANELAESPDFLQLVKDYLKWVMGEWEQFHLVIEDSDIARLTMDEFQEYITFNPNGEKVF